MVVVNSWLEPRGWVLEHDTLVGRSRCSDQYAAVHGLHTLAGNVRHVTERMWLAVGKRAPSTPKQLAPMPTRYRSAPYPGETQRCLCRAASSTSAVRVMTIHGKHAIRKVEALYELVPDGGVSEGRYPQGRQRQIVAMPRRACQMTVARDDPGMKRTGRAGGRSAPRCFTHGMTAWLRFEALEVPAEQLLH
jgi:hypothetical protein